MSDIICGVVVVLVDGSDRGARRAVIGRNTRVNAFVVGRKIIIIVVARMWLSERRGDE